LLSQKAKSTPPIISLKILVNGVQSQTAHVGDTLSTIWESQNYPDGSYVIILIKINGIPHEYTQHELPSDTITFIIEEDDFLPLPAIIELKAILYDIGGFIFLVNVKYRYSNYYSLGGKIKW